MNNFLLIADSHNKNTNHYTNGIIEWRFQSTGVYHHPFVDFSADALFYSENGEQWKIPLYWAGENEWRLRFSASKPGKYSFMIEASDTSNTDIHGLEGIAIIEPYTGENKLLKHGPVTVKKNNTYFIHEDGTPFFWLADSWWFGMCKRIKYPEGFTLLVGDRVEKEFSVIQFAIGLACDIEPLDPRDSNEGGLIWDKHFSTINPRYFEYTDQRIIHLVDSGLMPCIVGAWGYYMEFMGVEKLKQHWRYLMGRYGAFPLVWTLCGESRLVWYLGNKENKKERALSQIEGWTQVARYVQSINSFKRMLTIHPGPKFMENGKDLKLPPLNDMTLVDFLLLQPGHSDHDCLEKTYRDYNDSNELFQEKPVFVGECAWEGMHGAAGPKVQRNLFWCCMLLGMKGHSYGTDSLWQMNSIAESFGQSPQGHIWGVSPWEEAYKWEGSKGVSIGKKILQKYKWWEFQYHPEWINSPWSPDNIARAFAAGIDDEVRVVYFPKFVAPWGNQYCVLFLKPHGKYYALYISPIDGQEYPIGNIVAEKDGVYKVPAAPILHDWVFILLSV